MPVIAPVAPVIAAVTAPVAPDIATVTAAVAAAEQARLVTSVQDLRPSTTFFVHAQ